MRVPESLTLRFAFPDDERALRRLAALDSAAVPPTPALVAEVGGELRAALSLSDGSAIADPFHFTQELTALLRARGAQLAGATPRRRGVGPVMARLRRRHRAARLRASPQ